MRNNAPSSLLFSLSIGRGGGVCVCLKATGGVACWEWRGGGEKVALQL